MNIYSITDRVSVDWHPEVATVVESWTSFDVGLEDFRKAVFVKGINHSKASQGKGWILDTTKASGSFPADVEEMIERDRFPALSWTGARYFITINPALSETKADPETESSRGVQRVESPSVDAALAWLKEQP